MPDANTSPFFVDTNIWLYAFIEDGEHDKSALARTLIQRGDIVLSTQVVNEVCVNLLKNAHFPEERLRQLINSFCNCSGMPLSRDWKSLADRTKAPQGLAERVPSG